jgi:hypothetical protein
MMSHDDDAYVLAGRCVAAAVLLAVTAIAVWLW